MVDGDYQLPDDAEQVPTVKYVPNYDGIKTVENVVDFLSEVLEGTHFLLHEGVSLEEIGRSGDFWVPEVPSEEVK